MSPISNITENQILGKVDQLISDALPRDWSARLEREPRKGRWRPDAILRVAAPDGETVEFVIEAKRTITPQSLAQTLDQMLVYIDKADTTGLLPLVAASYLGPRSKELLTERGISYVDTTGNLRLVARRPGLFVERSGAAKDPWPDDQPLRSLRGRGAGRAVRALVDFRPPYGVRGLAARADVSAATLSRVIDLLAREALLTRDDKAGVAAIDWAGAIRRWSQDYELRRSNTVSTFLDPRGLSAVVEKLGEAKWRYAATGSLAALRFAPIAPARTAIVYVEDSLSAAIQLGLKPADAGANVVIVEPFDNVVFDRTVRTDGLVTVAPTQLAADLLTGPGREPSEGEELLEWMEKNQDAWRA